MNQDSGPNKSFNFVLGVRGRLETGSLVRKLSGLGTFRSFCVISRLSPLVIAGRSLNKTLTTVSSSRYHLCFTSFLEAA